MGGLAIGAWAAGTHPRLIPSDTVGRLRAYASIEVAIAVFALLVPLALSGFMPALSWAYADGAAPVRFALVRVGICLSLVGIPAAAMGATFPIAVDAMARSRLDAGLLYATNTAGAAAGAIAAGFWLIPWLGLRGTTWIGMAPSGSHAPGPGFRRPLPYVYRRFALPPPIVCNRCGHGAQRLTSLCPSWPARPPPFQASPPSCTRSHGRGCSRS